MSDNKQNSLMKIYKEDEIIIREGERCNALYKILSGSVALYLHYGEENEYLIGAAGESKCFGEVSMLAGRPSPYTVVAIKDAMVMQVTEDQFESFIIKNTHNAIEIMKNMAKSVVMLSADLDLMADDYKNTIKTLEERLESAGGDNMPKVIDISDKLEKYKISALNGSNYFKNI
ncbi:MAG: Crp/Fnr family transcriptional regulator [Oscillospiraceae bacterium]|nr:Crp/Fnr family transcriptional regulator [Oscillospiraceae bacterium]